MMKYNKMKKHGNRRKMMVREDYDEGDLLYDTFENLKDDGDSCVDMGEIPTPSTTYVSDDVQE